MSVASPRRASAGRRLLMLLLLSALLPLLATPTHATVDLVSPPAGALLAETTVSFDYYLALSGATSCTLTLNDVAILSGVPDQGFNSFLVDNLDPGYYAWGVSCTAPGGSESSQQRNLTIDTAAPVVTILGQPENTTALRLNFTVTDDQSRTLDCSLLFGGALLDSMIVTNGTLIARNYSVAPGTRTLLVSCEDAAGNRGTASRDITILPEDRFRLAMDKPSYALGKPARLTVDAPPDANVTIDICPLGQGFVQCISPLIGPTFPQTVLLPFLNQSGSYVVDGLAYTPRGTLTNTTNFTVENTLSVTLRTSGTIRQNDPFKLVADASGGIGGLTYTWRLSNGSTISTGNIAEIGVIYRAPGNYEEKVTVKDSAGNQKEASLWVIVQPTYPVLVTVLDNRTGSPLDNVTIELTDNKQSFVTGPQGTVIIDLEGGTEYNGTQDVIMVTEINKSKTGKYGTYDYEIRIPATLRDYRPGVSTVSYYTQLK